MVVFLLVLAYSLFCKKILLLGNVVAAGLSMAPGLIMLIDVKVASVGGDPTALITAALVFLAIGALVLAREIKFDEFDKAGDRIGGLTTLPMLLNETRLNFVYLALNVTAVILFLSALSTRSRYPFVLRGAIAISIGAAVSMLMVGAYQSEIQNDILQNHTHSHAVGPDLYVRADLDVLSPGLRLGMELDQISVASVGSWPS